MLSCAQQAYRSVDGNPTLISVEQPSEEIVSIPNHMNLRVMTYNIRLDHAGDKENNWEYRKRSMVDLIRKNEVDFLGVQEALPHQLQYLIEHLDAMHYIGQGRDGVDQGEYSAILYNSMEWQKIADTTFWLSPTPNKISLGWDANLHRICTFGLFINPGQDTIAVFNTHLDHVGQESRKQSVKLILNRISTYQNKYPVVLMGDFNFTPDNENYSTITGSLTDSRNQVNQPYEAHEGTFNGFKTDGPFVRRIDYIFSSNKGIKTIAYKSLDARIKGRHISDHFPVMADFKLTKQDQQ